MTAPFPQSAAEFTARFAEPNTDLSVQADRANRKAEDLNRWHRAAGCRDRIIGKDDVLAAAFAEVDAAWAKGGR